MGGGGGGQQRGGGGGGGGRGGRGEGNRKGKGKGEGESKGRREGEGKRQEGGSHQPTLTDTKQRDAVQTLLMPLPLVLPRTSAHERDLREAAVHQFHDLVVVVVEREWVRHVRRPCLVVPRDAGKQQHQQEGDYTTTTTTIIIVIVVMMIIIISISIIIIIIVSSSRGAQTREGKGEARSTCRVQDGACRTEKALVTAPGLTSSWSAAHSAPERSVL